MAPIIEEAKTPKKKYCNVYPKLGSRAKLTCSIPEQEEEEAM